MGPIHDRSSLESGFEPGTFLSRSRYLTSIPPQPLNTFKKVEQKKKHVCAQRAVKDIFPPPSPLSPRWPSGKVSPSRPQSSRFETQFDRRSVMYVGLHPLRHM
ncbi:hypothetical protein AVEN_82768-1 [Araneus ventricosus]|uniref:Uncharacterized protein n=1 Tax=Araneus ventricosus TaxID=182803 RepID=A0A4Y2E959_ARAVE|nr:hypothetical protein AVEN_82768-1 [Araneus ventricosus]